MMTRLHVNHPRIQKMVETITADTNHYSGGPIRDFECVGRETFIVLLRHGLLPFHRVLDFGCGSLRLGYWLVRFLESERYFGIDPIKDGVEAGLKHAIGNKIKEQKEPKFKYIDTCDMTLFKETFDYVVARSILTHTAPGILHHILESFAVSAPDGTFLASYWAKEGEHVIDTSNADPNHVVAIGDDLPETDKRFVAFVKYSFEYMQYAADKAGLVVEELNDAEIINEQIWLKFSHK